MTGPEEADDILDWCNFPSEVVVCEHMLGFVRTVGRVDRSLGFLEAGVKQFAIALKREEQREMGIGLA